MPIGPRMLLRTQARVVEWDRERVVPIIEQAIRTVRWAPFAVTNRDLAEAVFDAIKEASDGAE